MAKITILVGMYKAGQFIEAKLDNLKRQSIIKDCHIVFLNCQNLDNEDTICRDFISKNDDITATILDYDKHVSLYTTWNDAIRTTSSEYIVNANVDDMWHESYLERLTNILDEHEDYSVAYTYVLSTSIKNQSDPSKWINQGGLSTKPFPGGTMGPCPVWRRLLHDIYGYFNNFQVISDGLMWEKWRRGGEKFYQVPEPLVLYFHNPNSLERRVCPHTGVSIATQELREIGVHN